MLLAGDLVFCAAAAWPLTILLLWAHGGYSSNWRRQIGRVILTLAVITAVLLSFAHIGGLLPPSFRYVRGVVVPREGLSLTAYNGFFFLWSGALIFLPGRLRGRLSWISVAALLVGIFLLTLQAIEKHFSDAPAWLHDIAVVSAPLSLFLVVAGGLFGFARFRFSDIFAQVGLRILLGALLGLASSFIAFRLFGSPLEGQAPSVQLSLLGSAVIIWIAIVSYAKITVLSDWLVDLQIFRQADYQRELKCFREAISTESDPLKIFDLGIELTKNTLRIKDSAIHSEKNICASTKISSHSFARGQIFPIGKGEESEAFSFAITLGPGPETLFNAEIDFLREICLTIGRRLEAIDREKENIEHARREAQLIKQLVEAEYRSLRTQVNPHFLFNSLNSIAAPITADPQSAEEMTIRLAKIFRRVLTHHDRPFSTIGEEISFLEAYLEIEKVRFGVRLQVTFEVQESVRHVAVPALILQPLVENSLKHGLV